MRVSFKLLEEAELLGKNASYGRARSPLEITEENYNEIYIRINSLRVFNKNFFKIFENSSEDKSLEKEIRKIKRIFFRKKMYQELGKIISKLKSDSDYLFDKWLHGIQELRKSSLRRTMTYHMNVCSGTQLARFQQFL